MLSLFRNIDECNALTEFSVDCFTQVVKEINSIAMGKEGGKKITEMKPLKGHKRTCRIDPDLKDEFTQAVFNKKAKSAAAFGRATGIVVSNTAANFTKQSLLEYMAAGMLTFASRGDMSVALDATRSGNPALEFLVILAWCCICRRLFSCVPQVS